MMEGLMKKMIAMVPDEQLKNSVHGLSNQLIEYKNQYPVNTDAGEESIIIVLFESDKKLYYSICAIDKENKIVRQIKDDLVTDLLTDMLKTALNA